VGKVLLAHLPEVELQKILGQLELRRFTQNTVGNLQELQTQLQRVRRDGFACDLEEHESHVRCVAAPIWDHAGVVNASLSVTGPAVRMPASRIRQIAPLISKAGVDISRGLGFAGLQKMATVEAPRLNSSSPAGRVVPGARKLVAER
jgi:DNA-binding IclR family transcriptional regulator